MSAPHPVTGADTHGIEFYPRLNIVHLQKQKPKQFTLFILAWQEIRKPEYQPVAARYSEIAGIHGMPYTPWPGDPDQTSQSVRGPWLGYCNHASIMFPNWHRPYIMLLEQSICQVAYGIAGTYAKENPPESDEWKQAARELRFPFWDWTDKLTGTEGLPDVLVAPNLTLQIPNGQTQDVENILAHYKFHQPIDGFNNRLEYKIIYDARAEPRLPPDTMAYFKEWDRTYRCPNSSPIEVSDDIEQVNRTLKATGPAGFPVGSWANLTSDVSKMFEFPIDIEPELWANAWDEFSNTTFQSGHRDPAHPKVINNVHWGCPPIEQPHNNVHLVVGGIGHMGDNDTAGFDPIFYLHHCNVDRILSFWEHVYPYYVAGTDGFLDNDSTTRVPFTQPYGTFIETSVQEVTSKTPLMPFRNSNYDYWNSKDTHSLRLKKEVANNKYYTYPSIAGVSIDPLDPRVPNQEERERQRILLRAHFKPFNTEGPRQYIVMVNLPTGYFNGSYILKILIEVDGKELEIGRVSVLGRGKSTSCGNCQGRYAAGTRVRGVVSIPHEVVRGLTRAAIPTPAEPGPMAEPESMAEFESASEHTKTTRIVLNSLKAHVALPSGKVVSWPTNTPGETSQATLPPNEAPLIKLLSRVNPYRSGFVKHDGLPWADHGEPDLGSWVEAHTMT